MKFRLTDWGAWRDGSQTRPVYQGNMRVLVLVFQAQCPGMPLGQHLLTALVEQQGGIQEDVLELRVNILKTAMEGLTLWATMDVEGAAWARIWRTMTDLKHRLPSGKQGPFKRLRGLSLLNMEGVTHSDFARLKNVFGKTH